MEQLESSVDNDHDFTGNTEICCLINSTELKHRSQYFLEKRVKQPTSGRLYHYVISELKQSQMVSGIRQIHLCH